MGEPQKSDGEPSLNSRFGTHILSLLSLAALWEIAGRAMNSTLIPPLSQIGAAWWKLLMSGKLLANLSMSLTTLAIGFSLAVLFGIVVGLLMGRFRAVEHFLGSLRQRADVGADHRVRSGAHPVVRSRRGVAHRRGFSLRGLRHHHQHHDRRETGRHGPHRDGAFLRRSAKEKFSSKSSCRRPCRRSWPVYDSAWAAPSRAW